MDAQRLYELTKDWPAEAKPDRVYFMPEDGNSWRIDSGETNVRCNPSHAVMLFEASGIRWLMEQKDASGDAEVRLYSPNAYDENYTAETSEHICHSGATLIEAYDKAIKSIKP